MLHTCTSAYPQGRLHLTKLILAERPRRPTLLQQANMVSGERGTRCVPAALSAMQETTCVKEGLPKASGRGLDAIDSLFQMARCQKTQGIALSSLTAQTRADPGTSVHSMASVLSATAKLNSQPASNPRRETNPQQIPSELSENEAVPTEHEILSEFPLQEPPVCRHCGSQGIRKMVVHGSPNGNGGRWYWKCTQMQTHRDSFMCWDDSRGIRKGNPQCRCGRPSRQQAYGRSNCPACKAGIAHDHSRGYWNCAKGICWYHSDKLDGKMVPAALGQGFQATIVEEDTHRGLKGH